MLLTRHAILAGEADLRAMLRDRQAAFWYFDPKPRPQVLALARLVDRMYVTYLAQLDYYRAAGVGEVGFLPQGVDPERDRPARSAPAAFVCDASFVGAGQYPHRYGVLRALAAACRLQLSGPGWDSRARGPARRGRTRARPAPAPGHPRRLHLRRRERASRSRTPTAPPRPTACGRSSVAAGSISGSYVPDIEAFAIDGRHCAWYRSADEAAARARHYLEHPEERRRIAEAGRTHALTHHTYARRLELLLSGRSYEVGHVPSDERVVPELEDPNPGQALDRP